MGSPVKVHLESKYANTAKAHVGYTPAYCGTKNPSGKVMPGLTRKEFATWPADQRCRKCQLQFMEGAVA